MATKTMACDDDLIGEETLDEETLCSGWISTEVALLGILVTMLVIVASVAAVLKRRPKKA